VGRAEDREAPDARQKIFRLAIAARVALRVPHQLLYDETTKAMGNKYNVAAFKARLSEEAS